MLCATHPFKTCSYFNKKLNQLQCPLCIMPKELEQLVLESSQKPLANNSIIDIDYVESLAQSFVSFADPAKNEVHQQISAIDTQIKENLRIFNSAVHEVVEHLYQKYEQIILFQVEKARQLADDQLKQAQKSKQMVQKLHEIRNKDPVKCIETITQLQNAISSLNTEQKNLSILNFLNTLLPKMNEFQKSAIKHFSDLSFSGLDEQPSPAPSPEAFKRQAHTRQQSVKFSDQSFKVDKNLLPVDQIKKISLQCQKNIDFSIASLLVSNNLIVVGTKCGKLVLYDQDTLELQFTSEDAHQGPIRTLCKSQNSELLASSAADKSIKIWKKTFNEENSSYSLILHRDLEQQVAQAYQLVIVDEINHAVLKKIGILIAGSADNTVRIWNLQNGQYLYTYSGHQGDVYGVQFVPKLNLIASASQDKTVRLWDGLSFKYNKPVHKFVGHTDSVTGVLAVSEGDQVLSCSLDKTLRVWDCDKKICLRTIAASLQLQTLQLLQPGIAVSRTFDSKVKIFDYRICSQIHEIDNLKRPISAYTVDEENKCLLCGDEQRVNLFY